MEPPPPEPVRGGRRRFEPVLGLLVAVTWGATAFAVSGLLSVALDRDLLAAEVYRLYGLGALVVAGAVVWVAASVGAASPRPWVAAVAASAGVYFAFLATGLIASTAVFVEEATSPFVLASAVLAAAAVLGAAALVRRPPRDPL